MLQAPAVLELQFIRHPADGSTKILDTLTECLAASDRHEALTQQLDSNPFDVNVVGWIQGLAAGWDQDLRDRVNAALPFHKDTVLVLRDFLDLQPDAVQADVAAYIRLGNRFGVIPYLNGKQVQRIVRMAWCETGLERHRVPFRAPCPVCARAADASLRFEPGGRIRAWQLNCIGCGYYEEFDHSRIWSVQEYSLERGVSVPSAAELAEQVRSIVSAQSASWLKRAEIAVFPQLRVWLNRLERQLVLDAAAVHADLVHMEEFRLEYRFSPSTCGDVCRSGHGSFELRSNVLTGRVTAAEESGVRYGARYCRALDAGVREVPVHKFEQHVVEVKDVVAHWRPRFAEMCASLKDALVEQHFVRAIVAAGALAYAINNHGVVTDLMVSWADAPHDLLMQALRADASDAGEKTLPAPAGVTLSEFVANGLTKYGVPAEEVAALVQQYWVEPSETELPG